MRYYKIALVWTEETKIQGVVVSSLDSAVELELSPNFIKWVSGWTIIEEKTE